MEVLQAGGMATLILVAVFCSVGAVGLVIKCIDDLMFSKEGWTTVLKSFGVLLLTVFAVFASSGAYYLDGLYFS